ncbi:YCII-related domain-containing protein [Halanaerobium saccharolyticum]|uniref:YCII-related domain-containing protein n=1 Tax=Halanaerobium saccharolyticum TaxID=43595 RepID=A0A4R6LBR7_9FIRM|nr:YciI family protein [Halanaerobium saccharolyticum]TDO73407.1 YCII-related domain-containing protein [Halanaerobium saccharolyticum]
MIKQQGLAKGDKLFVRIDYRENNKEFTTNDFEKHFNYLKKVAGERYFIGGGFENEKGGMIVFKANNLKEAKEIAENDPLIKKSLYTYKIYEWNLLLLSEQIEK